MASTYPSPSPTTTTTTVDQSGAPKIAALHPDIIHTHILTRLDGPTLASAACASSDLHALASSDDLWRDICAATWPSISHPWVTQLVSTFPAGHRSFYSDSFPALDHVISPDFFDPDRSKELISAVDIYYRDRLVFSRVKETETVSEWFHCSPFLVDLVDQKESLPAPIKHVGEDQVWLKHLEENLTLSWILIDPMGKRAANLSSRRPVSVQRHWLTGEIQFRFATIMNRCRSGEYVQCGMVVTCGGKEGGEMHVKEVSMHLEDMEGRHLNGKESLIVLGSAINGGKRKKFGNGEEGKERFEEYLEMKREWREKKQRRERALDFVCILTGVSIFVSFWSFILFR
ncbi:hypothetical protein UlMin_017615 [Ulmus minor]